MVQPDVLTSLMGEQVYYDDRAIICSIKRWLYLPDGAPDQKEVAIRIVQCVNAMAGVADPEKGVKAFRELLKRLYLAETPEEMLDLKDVILKVWGLISPMESEPAQPRC